MSAYFTTDMFNIIVRQVMRDGAVKCLSESNIYDVPSSCHPVEVHVEELGNGRYELTPEWNPFSGDWSNSGPGEEIGKFLKTYCEPGSYISQRCDDYFEYSIFYLDDKRKVQERFEGYVNPFYDFANVLRKKSVEG